MKPPVLAVCPVLLALTTAAGATGAVHNGLLAFVVGVPNSDPGRTTIDTATATGKRLRVIRDGVATVNDTPSWSPDGRRIAFARTHGTKADIYVMDANGRHMQRLTFADHNYTQPSWSPDGRQIAFTGPVGQEPAIYVMNADGTDEHPIVSDADQSYEPAWSPDGSHIAYVHTNLSNENSSIWTCAPDGSDRRELSASTGPVHDWDPNWSPDGRLIAFASDRSGDSDVWVMHADGTGARDVTNDPAAEFHPTWSPDGRRLAFESDLGRKGHYDIWTIGADGTHRGRVTRNLGQGAYQPTWQRLP